MPPKPVTDKFRLKLYHENKDIPHFALLHAEFVAMWDGTDYSASDKRSIYESVLLVVLRNVSSLSDQETLEPVLLEMALVKFLAIWLKWGIAEATTPVLLAAEQGDMGAQVNLGV
jgi:hypothetical protein